MLDAFADRRMGSWEVFAAGVLRQEYPSIPGREIEQVVDREREFEVEFRRKMRDRLKSDMPKALAIPDPAARVEAVRKILEREKRFSTMREEAMLNRAIARVENNQLRESSPEGAFWKLSPHVAEHTLDCLAMGQKFWPWTVLRKIAPPLHAGCPCELMSLDEAVAEGLMTRDQVPDEADAIRRANELIGKVQELQDFLGIEECEVAVAEIVQAHAAGELEEARRGMRDRLRWEKGYVKGGEYRPERGGSSARTVMKRLLPNGLSTPIRGRERGVGRWTWVDGRYTRIPEQTAWERTHGGVKFHSPAGSTNVYRNGALIEDPTSERRPPRSPGATVAAPPADLKEKIEVVAARRRAPALKKARAAAKAKKKSQPPVSKGEGGAAILALPHAGFELQSALPSIHGHALKFKHGDAELFLEVAGDTIKRVEWEPTPGPAEMRISLERPPRSFAEHARDALAWADEIGARYGATVTVPEVRVDDSLGDHAGVHQWSGDVDVGNETPVDIVRGARARAEKRQLTDDEKRGIYASYWVTAHEISHGVNMIDPFLFKGGHANLEEALAEEAAHVLVVERLTEQGQGDVVRWRADNPDHPVVRGNYASPRHELALLLDEAQITDQVRRREFIFDLKFRVDPSMRMERIAEAIKAAGSDDDLEDITRRVEESLTVPDAEGDPRPALVFDSSPGAEQMGIQYGRFANSTLSDDGKTLTMPEGDFRRIEKLPMTAPELVRVSDGSAIAAYRKGEEPTDGLTYADGSPKNFRYVDTEDRAKLILRGFTGKGSPGTLLDPPPEVIARAVEEIRAAKGGVVYIEGVPVKRRFDDSFGVGWFEDGRNLSGVGGIEDAARLALIRSVTDTPWSAKAVTPAPPESPGTDDDGPGLFDHFFNKLPDALKHSAGEWLKKDGKLFAEPVKATKPKRKKPEPKKEFIGGKKGVKSDGPIPAYDAVRLEVGKAAGGSNGARWAFDKNGRRWLVKQYRGDADRIATELLANQIYREMGAKVAEAGTIDVNGKPALTYPTLEGEVRDSTFRKNGPSEEVGRHYMVDALVANWDFVGMTDDNIMWDPDGKPFRVDQGGTFEFRAMGSQKPFGPIPTEVWTMLSKGQAKRASAVTEDQMREQAAEIVKTLTPERVDALVDASPFEDEEMAERIKENMSARVRWMDGFAKGEIELPKPLEGGAAAEALVENTKSFDPTPEQEDSLFAYVEGFDAELDEYLRNPKVAETKPLARAKRELDSLFRALPPTSEDVIAYIGFDYDVDPKAKGEPGADLVGQQFQERGFLKATLDPVEAERFATVIRVVIPEGSHALFTPALGYEEMPPEPQVILARDSRLRIQSRRIDPDTGKLVFEATVKTEKAFKPFKPPKRKGGPKVDPAVEPPASSSVWDDIAGTDVDAWGQPKPPQSPGTTGALGSAAPSIPEVPRFHTPDKKVRKENIAAAEALRKLALAGDLEGVKGYSVDPKAAKVLSYRDTLVGILDGTISPPSPKPAKVIKPKPAEAEPATAEIVKAEAELNALGITVLPGAGSQIPNAPWMKILTAVRAESARLNERWPGITDGMALERQKPGPSALGVYDLHKKTVRLMAFGEKTSQGHKNKFGKPWTVTTNLAGTFRHEFGHLLDYRHMARFRDAVKQTDFRDDDGNEINAAKWAKRNLSEYGGSMTSETIAEMFALYTDESYVAGTLPERIEAIMEAMATGGEPPPPERSVPVDKLGDKDLGIKPKGVAA